MQKVSLLLLNFQNLSHVVLNHPFIVLLMEKIIQILLLVVFNVAAVNVPISTFVEESAEVGVK